MDTAVTVSLQAVGPFTGSQSWIIKAKCDNKSHEATLNNPFSEDEEDSLRWYLEHHPVDDPYSLAKAEKTAASLEQYGNCLYSSLQPFLTALEIDPQVTPCILQISGLDDGTTVHSLHWETLEHPSLELQIVVCRVMDGLKSSGPEASRKGDGKPRVLFMTSRLIDGDVQGTDIDHLPALRGFLDSYSSLSDDIRGPFDVECGYYDIVHLDVHGMVAEGASAALRFTDESDWKTPLWIDGSDIASLLTAKGVMFVVLNACNSAKASANVEANLAAILVRSGISGVVGMSYILTISAAEIFTRAFYQSFLVRFDDIAVATVQSRRALCTWKDRLARFQMTIQLEDWIIPVVYLSKAASETQAKDVSLRQALQGLPTMLPPGSRILPVSASQVLIGRDHDMFRLESYLAKHKAVELCGGIGVGKSSLIGTEKSLGQTPSSWLSTTFVDIKFSWNLQRVMGKFRKFSVSKLKKNLIKEIVNRSQRLTNPMLPKDELYHPSKDAHLELWQALEFFESQRLLIILDHVDDIFMALKDVESEVRLFRALLEEFQNIAKGTSNCYVLIVTSILSHRTPSFHPVRLCPLSRSDALELFQNLSPKIRTIAKSDYLEMKLLERFVQSLSGNPLVLRSYAKRFEESGLPTIRQFVRFAWTRALEKSPGFIEELLNSHSWTYAVPPLETLQFPDGIRLSNLSDLIYFNEHIPEDWNLFLESTPSDSSSIESWEPCGDLTPEEKFSKCMNELTEMCLVSKEDGESGWSVHPFLHLILEIFLNCDHFGSYLANLRKDFSLYYHWLLAPNIPTNEDGNLGRPSATISSVDGVIKLMDDQFVNVSSMLWITLDAVGDRLLEELPELLLGFITTLHTHGLDRTSTDLYVVYALLEDYVKHVNEVFSSWESRVLTSRSTSGIDQDTNHAMVGFRCNCRPVILTLARSLWLFQFHLNSGIAEKTVLQTSLDQASRIWAAYLRLFPDESHRTAFEGILSHSDLLLCKATLEIALVNFSRVQVLLDEAKRVLQPLQASSNENEQSWFCRQTEKCDFLETYTKQSEARFESTTDNHEDSQGSTAFIESAQRFRNSSRQAYRSSGIVAYEFISRNLRSRQLWPYNAEDLFDEDPSQALSLAAMGIIDDRTRQSRNSALEDLYRSQMLTALGRFESTQNLPDRFATLMTLALEAAQRNDHQQALVFYEQMLQCLDSWSGANANEKNFFRSAIYVDMGFISLRAIDYRKALGFLHEAYKEARRSGNGPQERLLFLHIFNGLLWSEWPQTIDWERICGLTKQEVLVQFISLHYEPMIWECSYYRRLINLGRLEVQNFREKFELAGNGRLFFVLYAEFIDEKIGKDIFRLSQLSSETIQLIAGETGASVREIETFICQSMAPALWRTMHRPWSSPQDLEMEIDKIFWEAERALFAPAEMRNGFCLIDRKYETMGLRKIWPLPENEDD